MIGMVCGSLKYSPNTVFHLCENRFIQTAAIVPNRSESIVVNIAITILFCTACAQSGSENNFSYHWVENPSLGNTIYEVGLKDIGYKIKMGRIINRITNTAKIVAIITISSFQTSAYFCFVAALETRTIIIVTITNMMEIAEAKFQFNTPLNSF